MYLEVTNLGEKQTFHAQCRVLARRNDPNPQRLLTLDLGWVRKGRELEIHRGETCSLYVARSGQDRPLRDIEWIEIVGSPEPVQSQWAIGQVTPLPEYDVEIVIFGGENQEPYSEKFTIRAGRECALEMFKLKTNSEVRETAKQSFPNQLQERGPHIVFLGADTMWLRQDQDHDSRLLIFRDTQGQHGDVYGAVACFRNDPAQSATAYGLRANLRLMDSQGSEIGRGIPGGCWLDETTDLIDLKPDESACVLANNGKWTIPWKERRQTGLNEDSISDRTFALTGLPITVEIRLRDRDGNLRLGPLAIGIALVNGHITVTARQPS